MRLRDVEWIEISTSIIKGGMAGRPLQIVDVKDEILAGLRGMQISWELRETTWSKEKFFEDEPVQIIRFVNPFGPMSSYNTVEDDAKLIQTAEIR